MLGDSIPVTCVHCQKQAATSLESIDSREPITCPSCGKAFGIGDVFQRLYENEPIVKKSLDAFAGYAASQWALKANDPDVGKATDNFLRQVKFDGLLGEAATQVLVHGDAFLRVGAKDWQLLPPQQVRVKTSFAPQGGSKALFIRDDEFVLTTGKGTESFKPEEVVHFKKTLLSGQTPYGESKIQITLIPLNNLRAYRSAPLRAQAEFDWWHDHLQEQLRMGLGVPDFLLEKKPPTYDPRVAEFMLVGFLGEVGELQWVLSNGFNEALERFAKKNHLAETPKLQPKKLTTRRVLLDLGFSFSKEIAMLRKLHELGIITKEQLDKMLDEYKP